MQSLGERLQEARQRLGVTVREAADVTKIRGDFLQAMEANQFESIPLADVYKRGFVRIYAKYLRLDDEKAASDFNAHHSVRASRRPLDLGSEPDEVPEGTPLVSSLSKETLLWVVGGGVFVGLLLWVLLA
jgi:cytoskeletal protein RodZ